MKSIINKNWEKIKSDLEVLVGVCLFAWIFTGIINAADEDETYFPMVTLMTLLIIVFVQAIFSMVMFSYEFNLKASFGMTRREYFVQFVVIDVVMMLLYSLVIKGNLLLENWIYIDNLKCTMDEDAFIVEAIANNAWLILIMISAIKLLNAIIYIRLGQKFLAAFSFAIVLLFNLPAILKKFGVVDKDISAELFNYIANNSGIIVVGMLVMIVVLFALSWVTFRKHRVML